MPKFAFTIVSVIILGGIIVSAERSVPGKFLYFFKTHINEPITELSAFGNKNEAFFQIKIIGRRLEEVEFLFAAGKLTSEQSVTLLREVTENMDELAKRTNKLIETNKTSDVSAVHSAYEVILEIHGNRLSQIISTSPQGKVVLVREFLALTQERLSSLFDDRRLVETKEFAELGTNTLASAENAQKIARAKIDDATTFVAKRQNAVSKVLFVQATEKLKLAEAAFSEGKAKIEANAYRDAFALFKKAEREEEAAKLLFSMAVPEK